MSDLSIGELAHLAEVGTETVRFYERRGLLPDPPRRPSGYRSYPPDAVRRLRFIRRAKELGFSLREIQELLELRTESSRPCGDVQEQVVAKLADVVDRIRDLERMQAALRDLQEMCEQSDPMAECPILDLLDDVDDD